LARNSQGTYLNSLYHRITTRRGSKRAAVVVGHAILIICYYMIKNKSHYNELGVDYFKERNKDVLVRQSVKRLSALGFEVL